MATPAHIFLVYSNCLPHYFHLKVDRFGQQTLFLLLSPFADFRTDFLDRTRQNVIKHFQARQTNIILWNNGGVSPTIFQAFFPIPFAEFNQLVAGTSTRQAEMFLVHKERGRFDADDWNVAALFGSLSLLFYFRILPVMFIYDICLNFQCRLRLGPCASAGRPFAGLPLPGPIPGAHPSAGGTLSPYPIPSPSMPVARGEAAL